MPAVRCPACGGGLVPGSASCPGCGLPLATPDALRLWDIDQQLAALGAERGELLSRLRSTTPAVPRGAPAVPPPSFPPSFPVPGPGPVKARPALTGQQLLLGVGVLLVLVAATVFLAVAWQVLGAAGQTAVLAAVTVGAGYAALRLSARRLRASAAAAAVLTVGLAVVDAAAAREFDLAGLRAVTAPAYAAAVGLLLAVALAAVSRLDRRLVVFPVAAVLAAGIVPVAALGSRHPDVFVVSAVLLLAAALSAVAVGRLDGPPALTCRLVLLGHLVGFLATAIPASYVGPLLGTAAGCGLLALGLAAVAAASTGRLPRWRVPLLTLSGVAGTPALVGLAQHGGPAGLTGLAVVAALVGAAAAGPGRRPTGAVGIGGGTLTAALACAVAAVRFAVPSAASSRPLLALSLAAAGGSAAYVAVRRPGLRAAAAGYAAVALAASAGVAVATGRSPVAGALAVAAVLIAATAGARRGRAEEVTLLVAAAAALLVGLAVSADRPARVTAGVLALGGLAALGYAVLPRRGAAAVPGVLLCSASTWTLLHAADVRVVEAYSGPLAVLALAVGTVRLLREPAAPSWATVGPGLSAALLPSAVASLDDPGLLRPLLTLAAALAVLVAGVVLRWQSPVLVGSAAAVLVAGSQLAPYAVGSPRWLSLGVAGSVLLAVGARYEQRRRDAQAASRWLLALH